MLPNLKRVYEPRTVAEAVRILKRGRGAIVPLAGGVSFVFNPNPKVEGVVLLRRLPLSYIRRGRDGLRIGAATLISDIVTSSAARSYAGGILCEAAFRVGSTLNRNLITIGGNLVQPFIWSTMPAVALALGARIRIRGARRRTMRARDFYAKPPRSLLSADEIVEEVLFPALPRRSRAAYRQFTITENDFALLKVAACLRASGRRADRIRIAVGGATLLPQRAKGAEAVLEEGRADRERIEKAAEDAAREIKIARDIRVSTEYKRTLARVLVTDTLTRLFGRSRT